MSDPSPGSSPAAPPPPKRDGSPARDASPAPARDTSPAPARDTAPAPEVDPLAAEARRLRTEEALSVRQIGERLGTNRNRLVELLRGVPAPAWTKRPNARDDLRARSVELRRAGWTVPRIAEELGVARSTAYQWVRHLPLAEDTDEARERRRAHSRAMTDAQWGEYREVRDAAHAEAVAAAVRWTRTLNYRETILVGAAVYWCEGTKAKPWRPTDFRVKFVNSDPALILIFLRFVEALGVPAADLRYRVAIHETADAVAATGWWANLIGVPVERFHRPTVKRHLVSSRRRNTGDHYHGCLTVEVLRPRLIYWKIEGIMKGIAGEVPGPGR